MARRQCYCAERLTPMTTDGARIGPSCCMRVVRIALEYALALRYKARVRRSPCNWDTPHQRRRLKGGGTVSKKFLLSVFILSVLALTSGCAVNRATVTVSADADL